MPVVIRLTFPAGRYHATPWGRHVNEGVPEWPPSPWRLLRALVAVWKRTCPDIAEDRVKRVLEALTGPPLFLLPPHTVAHTRHYMPWEKKGPLDRTLVFDTFVSVGRHDPLYVGWPDVTLDTDDDVCLRRLLGNLTTFGRAEGWVEGEVVSFPGELPKWNCVPTDAETNPVQVFCPDPATAFGDEHYPTHDAKKLAKRQINPANFLFDCPRWHLCLDTETVHAEKWPTVPGSRWVNYARPGQPATESPKSTVRDPKKTTVARFMLDGPVLPNVTETLRVAEKFRIAAMGQFRTWCQNHPTAGREFLRTDIPDRYSSPTLAGKELTGDMQKDHGHAFYLPTAEGDDHGRFVTHVTVVTAVPGFGPGEVAALTAIRSIRIGDADEGLKLRVQLVGLGNEGDFTHWLFDKREVWESVTPFVAHRHHKKRGTKRDRLPEGTDWRQEFVRLAARECAERCALDAKLVNVEIIPDPPGLPPGIAFRRKRDRVGNPADSRAFGYVRLTFDRPVPRPAAFGYGCHFGLGLLRPVKES